MKRKLCSLLLALVMLLSVFPPVLTVSAAGTRLKKPSDLQWNYNRNVLDGNYIPGFISWKNEEPTQTHIRVAIFEEGIEVPIKEEMYNYVPDGIVQEAIRGYTSLSDFCKMNPESGRYYFTVTSVVMTDDVYLESETAVSEVMEYVKPYSYLDSCTELKWNWPYAKYTVPSDHTNLGGYDIEYFFSDTEGGGKRFAGSRSSYNKITAPQGMYFRMPDSAHEDFGSGYYYFRVRALSSDLTKTGNGNWSDFSPAYFLEGHAHVFDEWVTVSKPTCTAVGFKEGRCECGVTTEDIIPWLGHKFEEGICTVCGEKDPDYIKPTEPEPPILISPTITRIAGSDQIKTSLTVADKLKEVQAVEKFETIIVASATNFPDALSGGYLAAVSKAPILLYENGETIVTDYIKHNLAAGGRVYILGGPSVVSDKIIDALPGIPSERIHGQNRFATSLNVIQKADEIRGSKPEQILICTGLNFREAMIASATGLPVLIVNGSGSSLTDAQEEYLESARGAELYVIGDEDSVNVNLQNVLNAYDANGSERISGSDFCNTSISAAKKFFYNPKNSVVTKDEKFQNSLCAAPLAYAMKAPLILAGEDDATCIEAYIQEEQISNVVIVGEEEHKHTEVIEEAVLPTCTTPGKTQGKYCSECNQILIEQQEIPALDHTWDEGKMTKVPTETSEGVKTFTCTVCEATRTETIPMLDHDHSHIATVTFPTCTEKGYTTHTCACGDSYVNTYVDPLDHDWVDWMEMVHPTCTESGTKHRDCRRSGCDSVEMEYIDPLGHKFETGTCTVCGETDPDYEKPTEPTEPEPTEPEAPAPDRIAGTNRISTALTTADKLKEVMAVEKYNAIVVADAMNFPDALSGSYLAAAAKAPILLYAAGQNTVTDYIKANLSDGGTVYILGGESSVPESIVSALPGVNCERVSGSGRWATSLAIIAKADEIRGTKPDKVLICDGTGFADSLSASATGLPILLVNGKGTLREDQKAYLESVRGAQLYAIGGTNTITPDLLKELDAYDADGAERVFGSGRELTSAAVAKKFFPEAKTAALASSLDFPDGLSGGPVAFAMNAPLLLTRENKEAAAKDYVNSKGITSGYIIGGEKAVTNATAELVFGK